MPIKSFRGLLIHGGQDIIRLETNNGLTGYRIVKFQLMPDESGGHTAESTVKIYKTKQSTITTLVDFSDHGLLAAGFISNHTSAYIYPPDSTVIFENEVINQDIFVTNLDRSGDAPCNYYLELEQINLNLDQATVATLKDIRRSEKIS